MKAETIAQACGTPTSEYIVDVVLGMICRGSASMLLNTDAIHWGDIETISEAVIEACIVDGLAEDCFAPSIRCDGWETEIKLY
jgi:hypothetical protein